MNIITNAFKSLLVSLLIGALLLVQTPTQAYAAAADFQKAQVSFTFDDGFESAYLNAAPLFAAKGIKGTMYVIPGLEDGTTWGGLTDDGKPVMTWAQVLALQNTYGWEIGSHTQTHPELPTVTVAQQVTELQQSKAELLAKGITSVTTFASPYGAYDNNVLTEAMKDYQMHRGFADRTTLNTFPYTRQVIQVQSLETAANGIAGTTLAQAEAFVDQAIANKQWLVFVGHSIETNGSTTYEYTWKTSDLSALIDYIKSKNVPIVKASDAVKDPGVTMTTNAGFESGLTTGWTNDNATQVTLDTARNGSYPNPTNAVKMTGGTAASHLFSTLIAAVPGADYLVEAFTNTTGLTAGELGFYMDEYDANGTWISGQWLGLVANNTVGFFSKVYHATTDLVKQLRVQTYLTAGATGSVYTDNVNLFNLNASASATITPTVAPTATPTASPSGTPTVTPTGTSSANLITNGNFDSGIASGWTTDNATQVKADNANHGTAPTTATSVGMTGGTTAAHLFYGLIKVDATANYLLSAVANTAGLTSGELGFYMDEYDANGTWISGQWLGLVANGVTTTFSKAYKATTALVNQVRVQTYLTANAVGTAFVDGYNLTNQSVTPTPTPSVSVTPTITPTATPTVSVTPSVTPSVSPTVTPSVTPTVTPPTGTNLVVNNSFEQVGTFANNWTTDNSVNVVIDSASNGNDGTHSVHFTTNTAYAHLFSDQIAVDAASTYHWTTYIKALTGTGEFGFYIDEYDAAGTWISGQWKGMINAIFTGVKDFTYVPTSTNVKTVRLQYYQTPNSTFNLYLDSAGLSK